MRKVPKLRFKEFSDKWEEKTLGEVCKNIYSGKTINKNDFGKYKVYGSTGQIGWSNEYDYSGENILIARVGANAGTLNFINEKCGVSDNTLIAQANTEFYNKFIFFSLKNFNLNRLIFGSGQPLITAGQLKKIDLFFPIFQEQEKIANFLSSIDKKISLTEEKLELFREYKKGVMQKIFSQELRFKDSEGNDYPEWEEKKLSEISNLITKGTTPKKFEENGNVKFIKIEAISSNKISNKKCLFVSEKTHITELQRSILEKNDLLFSIAGSLGKTAIIVEANLPANTNQALCIIRLNENQNHKFILYLLNSKTMIDYIFLNTSIGAQPNLSLEQMKNFKFNLPTLEEQQKIADFLSSIDSKIESIEKELEGLKEFKKGLLQQMFV